MLVFGAAFFLLGLLGIPGEVFGGHCQAITHPMCQNVGYNLTLLPNGMGQAKHEEAEEELQKYLPIINLNCSKYLRLFVCSAFVPLCSEEASGAVPPCRDFCDDVKKDCAPIFEAEKLAWPAELNCSKYPEARKLCIQPPNEELHVHAGHELTPWDQLPRFRTELRHCPNGTALNEGKCLELCGFSVSQKAKEQALFEIWSAVWSFLCLTITSFALMTFIMQPKRFRWPARPILYLTMCGFATSVVYLIKWIGGPFTCSNGTVLQKPSDSLGCVGAALLLLFCEASFALWWFIFALVWFLSAAKEWSTEAIERISTRLHATVWITSVSITVHVLLSDYITTDEFTGLCVAKNNFLAIAEVAFVVLGAVFAVVTSVALKNVRKALVFLYAGKPAFKLERLIYRVGITSLGMCVPLFVCLMCSFFDSLTTLMVSVGMRFLSAIFAAMWVFSSKTFRNWNKILRPAFAAKGLRAGDIPVTKV